MSRLVSTSVKIIMFALVIGLAACLPAAAKADVLVASLTGSPGAAEELPLQASGSVPQLWPGRTSTLDVLVSNPSDNSRQVTVQAVAVSIVDAPAACQADNFTLHGYDRKPGEATYTVAPGETVSVPLGITMINSDTDQSGCLGVVLSLQYTTTSVAS